MSKLYLESVIQTGDGEYLYNFISNEGKIISRRGGYVEVFLSGVKVENMWFKGGRVHIVGGIESYMSGAIIVMDKNSEGYGAARNGRSARVSFDELIELIAAYGISNARLVIKGGKLTLKRLLKSDTTHGTVYEGQVYGRCNKCKTYFQDDAVKVCTKCGTADNYIKLV